MSFLITGLPVEQVEVVHMQSMQIPCPDGMCPTPGITRVEIPTENGTGALLVPPQEI
jgi:hypothetical protein